MRSKLYVIHNTTDKAARGEVSLHLNAFACPSLIKERKWGWIWRVSQGACAHKTTVTAIFKPVSHAWQPRAGLQWRKADQPTEMA